MTTRTWGWECPWSGDEHDPIPMSYRWWFRLYRATRTVRHWIGLHDWGRTGPERGWRRCTWCGKVRLRRVPQ